MKRILSILFCLAFAGQALGAIEFTVDGLKYIVTNSAEQTVSVGLQSSNSGDITIPATVLNESDGKTYTVTTIRGSSFGNYNYNNTITSVSIPNTVTVLENYAFSNTRAMTSISIPNSVTSIGIYAFSTCQELTSITIPNSVTSIGNDAFYSCTSLTAITIPNSVTNFGENVFSGCYNLTSVVIGSAIGSLNTNVFSGCSKLTSITVDAQNTNYASENGVLFNKEKTTLIYCPRAKNTLAKSSDYTILTENRGELPIRLGAMTSRTSQFMIVDLLTILYGMRDKDRSWDYLEKSYV